MCTLLLPASYLCYMCSTLYFTKAYFVKIMNFICTCFYLHLMFITSAEFFLKAYFVITIYFICTCFYLHLIFVTCAELHKSPFRDNNVFLYLPVVTCILTLMYTCILSRYLYTAIEMHNLAVSSTRGHFVVGATCCILYTDHLVADTAVRVLSCGVTAQCCTMEEGVVLQTGGIALYTRCH